MSTSNRMTDASDLPPSDELRAGEYVLGVLDAFERRHAQARIASEPGFARLVDQWENHFAHWLENVAPVAPPAQVWSRVCDRLGWSNRVSARPRLWNNVGFWRATAGLAAAAALAAVFVGRPPAPSTPVGPHQAQAARPVTVLQRDDGSTGWLVSFDTGAGNLLVVPVPRSLEDGRVNELWIIPASGAPLSLGYVSNERSLTIVMPQALRKEFVAGATLAISLEPPDGMPHSAPSGPIVAKGGIQSI